MEEGGKQKTSWWQTVPGILTQIVGIITAVTGLIVALNQAGMFGKGNRQNPPEERQKPPEQGIEIRRSDQQTPPEKPPQPPEILFQDDFNRSELGDRYQILHPDLARLTMMNGQLVIAAGFSDPGKIPSNLVLLQQQFLEDFTATIRLKMQVTGNNIAGLWYWVDSTKKLALYVHGFEVQVGNRRNVGRHIGFTKYGGDKPLDIWNSKFYSSLEHWRLGWLGERILEGYATKLEEWYFQLERKGSRYTGRVSINGVAWETVGTHTIWPNNGRLGFTAGFTHPGAVANEEPAEFDNFVVKRAQ